MQIALRIHILICSILLVACNDEVSTTDASVGHADSCFIAINGKKIDTAYLLATYKDPGAKVVGYLNKQRICPEQVVMADVTGSVNTDRPGTYVLNYNANDLGEIH